jgi:hypothetical protein
LTRMEVKTVDKNIKAELWALREEVLTNLKSIETTVNNLDIRLADEDEISCLSRCPELANLLEMCATMELHPKTPIQTVLAFTKLVEHATARLKVATVDRYADSMADLMHLSKRLDSKLGKLVDDSPMEALWENKFPGVLNKVSEYLDEIDAPTKAKPVHVDEQDIKNALDRMNQRLTQKDPLYLVDRSTDVDLSDVPQWARDINSKSVDQIVKEASEWDDYNQSIFGRMWNRVASRRIAIMEEVMSEVAVSIKSYSYLSERLSVRNIEDAENIYQRYRDLESAKDQVISVLKDFDREPIKRILENTADDRWPGDRPEDPENLENWVSYYDWFARLTEELERVANENPQGTPVVSNCLAMLRVLMLEKEPLVFTPVSEFSVPIQMPADKLEIYRKKAQKDYGRDLDRAYAWRNRKVSEQEPQSNGEMEPTGS